MHTLRTRRTDYSRTYILYRIKHRYYMLCWLEFGKDQSMYIWIDDNPNNSWEVTATHSQDQLHGTTTVTLTQHHYKVYDPHISWHPSQRVHVAGYNDVGRLKEKVISDKKAPSLEDIENGRTVPLSQLIFPTINCQRMLVYMGKDMPQGIKDNYYVVINQKGHKIYNSGSKEEAYLIIDDNIIPKGKLLGIDFCIHDKKEVASPEGILNDVLIFPDIISTHKDVTQNAFGLRLFSANIECPAAEVTAMTATCFNLESYDLFQLSRSKK